jgi:hypothetical protein
MVANSPRNLRNGVGQVPLHILFFKFDVFILNFIIFDFLSLSYNPDSGTEFIPNSDRETIEHTVCGNCTVYTASSLVIKFKYENMKSINKKNVKRNMPNI